jgi:16S rRNA processing protein RimM
MNNKGFIQIGSIVKTHGVRGEVIIETIIPDLFKNVEEPVFVEIDGLQVPFFIDQIKFFKNNRFRIKFDWINSEKNAANFINGTISLPSNSKLIETIDINENYELLNGFKVYDKTFGFIGKVISIIENTNNPLMEISYNNSEILIPIHENIILEINEKDKIITVETPNGLINLDNRNNP